jgi:molybdopterin-containing oxidoreductase family membrane subunit
MVLQIMAVPVLSFENWVLYYPSWQEVATTILPVAYGFLLILVSYRYLPIFPQETELNPIVETEMKSETETEETIEPAGDQTLSPAAA